MNHPDKYLAKRYDTPNRSAAFTDAVYAGDSADRATLMGRMNAAQRSYDPPAPAYIPLVGEMHGHTNLSDGRPDIDTYFRNIRDLAKLDFAVLSDHDHGGVGSAELWSGNPSKWELTRRARRKYGEDIGDTPFTTVLHRILGGVAMAGLGTAVFIPLILFDLLNGGFAIIHFVIGMLEASLYGTLGVYDVIRRIIRRRRAEGQRLEEEKQAWEGYLN